MLTYGCLGLVVFAFVMEIRWLNRDWLIPWWNPVKW